MSIILENIDGKLIGRQDNVEIEFSKENIGDRYGHTDKITLKQADLPLSLQIMILYSQGGNRQLGELRIGQPSQSNANWSYAIGRRWSYVWGKPAIRDGLTDEKIIIREPKYFESYEMYKPLGEFCHWDGNNKTKFPGELIFQEYPEQSENFQGTRLPQNLPELCEKLEGAIQNTKMEIGPDEEKTIDMLTGFLSSVNMLYTEKGRLAVYKGEEVKEKEPDESELEL